MGMNKKMNDGRIAEDSKAQNKIGQRGQRKSEI